MRIRRSTILALHYVGFLIGNYIITRYPSCTSIFIVLTAFWVFFLEWGLNYLNKKQILRTEIQRNSIVPLYYMAFVIINFINHHHDSGMYLLLIPAWTFFFALGLDYLKKRYYSRKSYYLYLAVAFLSSGFIAFVVAWIMDTVAARKEKKEVERNLEGDYWT
ncbi:hypothetical protein RSJ42_05325 [Methanosarcina hadiensis]|uniref:hypothetical protein n=1 Tax=Methanosarcina hadiensis TaxID=3078083 RepID=UPI003977DC03